MRKVANKWAKRLSIAVALPVVGAAALGIGTASAVPYPSVDVQVGAAVRTQPKTASQYFDGWVLNTGHAGKQTQRSWVKCWQDGDWATGGYRTNRWFKVYVNDTTHGNWAHWGFVHASYVYNQVAVPRC